MPPRPAPSPFAHPLVACLTTLLLAAAPPRLAAQAGAQALTRAEAVGMALARGGRLGVARADSAAAAAALVTARAWPDPSLAASYSRSVPQHHVSLEIPFDYPWLRSARVGSATAAERAAAYRFQFERAAVALDADTTYTRVLAARAHAALSRRNAADADSLRAMTVSRRDAGDASDLDVELATVNAGQQANLAVGDSLDYLSTLLDLQVLLGLTAGDVVVVPVDSLDAPPPGGDDSVAVPGPPAGATGATGTRQAPAPIGTRSAPITARPTPPGGSASPANPGGSTSLASASVPTTSAAAPLSVAAAQATLESATLGLRAEQRSIWAAPSLSAGFEQGDPSGGEPGILPTVGVTLPLPLFSRNRGPILQARAEQLRARAELALAEAESRAAIGRARRTRDLALARVARDRALVASAERVATMSRTAYREGASSLPNVLQAQRDARDVVAQYVDDLAAAWIATAMLRVVTLTTGSP